MKIFRYIFFIFNFFIFTAVFVELANCSTLRVLNGDNEPIAYATIEIKASGIKIMTNAKGTVSLADVSGEKLITISQLGYNKLDTTIRFSKTSDTINILLLELNFTTDKVVVTGTKTAKEIENLPIPTAVLMSKEIEEQSSPRLTNILEDQAGLTIVQTPGKGVQTQGLNPDYTLILINGEPMIGKTRGILDLERFSVGNISRVEIVKGPTSSLYGSNALAGVINIITEKPIHKTSLKLNSRYASFNTFDLGANAEISFNNDKSAISVYLNRFSTSGYSLESGLVSQTVPKITDYTASAEYFHKLSKKSDLKLSARFNYNLQANKYEIVDNGKQLIDEEISLYDINLGALLKHHYSPTSTINWKLYFIDYINNTLDLYNSSGKMFSKSDVSEKLIKAEFQLNKVLGSSHMITFGAGWNHEMISAERVVDGKRSADLFYSFLQEDYNLSEKTNLIASLRYDKHSNYSYSINPKFAMSYNFFEDLTARASVGTGFKAPNSENLYLDWSNPQYGYRVYGSSYIKQALEILSSQGRIQSYLKDLSNFGDLQPEKSWSVDFGFSYNYRNIIESKLNFFRNNLFYMIDLQPVAQDVNGQFIYTYYNLKSVYTQGIEARLKIDILRNLYLDFNYNLLFTGDNDAIKDIKNGKISKLNKYGVKRPVSMSEYGGLFFRSTHSGSVKLNWTVPSISLTTVLRVNIRSKYGFADINSNLILDDESEYVDGYSIWGLTFSKDIYKNFSVQAGIENIFDKKGTKYLSTTPGRTYFINIIFKLTKS